MKNHLTLAVGATAMLCTLAAMAQAPPGEATNATNAPVAGVLAGRGSFSTPVATTALERLRGGTHVQNDMLLTGTTTGNSAQQVVTGSNSISSGAFSNMSGLPVVIQNSGANVLIQNAVLLHVQMD